MYIFILTQKYIHRRLSPVIVEADGGGGEQVGVAVRLVVGEGHRDVELGLVCRYYRYCRYCVLCRYYRYCRYPGTWWWWGWPPSAARPTLLSSAPAWPALTTR